MIIALSAVSGCTEDSPSVTPPLATATPASIAPATANTTAEPSPAATASVPTTEPAGNQSPSPNATPASSPVTQTTTVQPTSTGIPTKATVLIGEALFKPSNLRIGRGTQVIWFCQVPTAHQIESDAIGDTPAGAYFRSERLMTGMQYSFVFTEPGTFTYHCAIHPAEKGTITVA
jgi:plastocyanin